MLDFGNAFYYIDFKALDRFIAINDSKNKENKVVETKEIFNNEGLLVSTEKYVRVNPDNELVMNSARYEMARTFIEYLIDYEQEDVDDTLGIDKALSNAPLGYKIIFNTLIMEGILVEQ